MAVILSDAEYPLTLKQLKTYGLSLQDAEVYEVLWESASKDFRYDNKKHLPWEHRRDCGGTTSWSKTALASHLKMRREKVAQCIDKLLDLGLITVVGLERSSKGSPHHVYRVIHPKHLEAQQRAMYWFTDPPSVRWKNYGLKTSKDTAYQWADEPTDYEGIDSDAYEVLLDRPDLTIPVREMATC